MSDNLLRIYHRLPGPLRSVAASLYGYHLRRDRYGHQSEQLRHEIIQRETWSAERWDQWRGNRLGEVLHHAATQVPYYRQQWADRRRRGDRSSWDVLENWPILEKEPIRQNPRAFLADDCDRRAMRPASTSGTTFKPLNLWWSRHASRQWYALHQVRCQQWYGVSQHDRWAHLGSRFVTAAQQRTPPFWVWNAAFRQLYMSSYHLAPDLVPHYLDALRQYNVRYLWGYPSSLYALAKGVLQSGRRDWPMMVAITDAEQLFDYQRQTIAEAFQCQVCETYGMNEVVAGASQCPAGTLHQWPEAGWIEVLDGDTPVAANHSGELICTGLINTDMPLIRYRVGDRGRLKAGTQCECGRTLPALAGLDGRADHVLYTTDGRAVGRLCTVIQGDIAVYEAQLIQEQLDRVRVKYVPTPQFGPRDRHNIRDRLIACMGEVDVVFEATERIPRGPNGKFPTVICQLPNAIRQPLATSPVG